METFHKFLSEFCVSPTIHVSWPNLAKIGRCEVAEKSSGIAYKKKTRPGHFLAHISPHLAYRAQNSAYNNYNSDDRVAQHLDYVQRTWLDSTVWPPSAWSAFKQPARTNNDVEGWHARLNSRANHGRLNMYQLLYLLHEEAVLVNIGVHLLSNAGTSRLQRKKVYTTPQPPVHDILCYVLTAFYNIMCSVNLRTVYVVVEEFFHVFDYRDYAYFVVTVMYI